MDHFLALEVWLVSIAAAGAIGWLIGDTRNAARHGIGVGGGAHLSGEDDAIDSLFSLTVPPKILPQAEPGHALKLAGHAPSAVDAAEVPRPVHQSGARVRQSNAVIRASSASPGQSMQRREIFADMPPIDEVRAEVELIRANERVWHTQDCAKQLADFMQTADRTSLEALEHFRQSIGELRKLEQSYGLVATEEGTELEMPRFSDAAPLCPTHALVEVAIAEGRDLVAEIPPVPLRQFG